MTSQDVIDDLKLLANPERAALAGRYFKTGPGEYAEGDKFLGLTTPQVGTVIRKHLDLSLEELRKLIQSPIHEARTTALSIMVNRFLKGDTGTQKQIFDLYMQSTAWINNWDLVDISAPKIVSGFLQNRDRSILYKLAESDSLWERRIAIMGTFGFIRNGQYEDTLKITKILLGDKHDLIHKATGWLLREVGKRDLALEEEFLKTHIRQLPRTTLRYAIEKFPEEKRQEYLKM